MDYPSERSSLWRWTSAKWEAGGGGERAEKKSGKRKAESEKKRGREGLFAFSERSPFWSAGGAVHLFPQGVTCAILLWEALAGALGSG